MKGAVPTFQTQFNVTFPTKTTVPFPNKRKLKTSQKTTALPKKVNRKDKDKENLIVPCSFVCFANYE